ncbi:sugar phosphate nucleotidyltransferase [Arenibaculum sp.]|jgi:NDP-sugar pyrophosphorylase family protein|uniref:sugar phosphate nucleotidyltransferase n=1 Tax=Arenibaculum sp. TaxID=2865862 RepID=UPI002E121B81|nr:sugar phosphate nucleotidyltransferase [Arenibaculum sp.]
MKAVILAGGKGTRLAPYTTVLPKPLMPVGGGMAILELLIRQLKSAGIVDLTLAVGYLAHLIEAVIGDGGKYGVGVKYSREDRPMGTAGPITPVIAEMGEDFLVMNGDLLTNIRFDRLVRHHRDTRADATIAVFRRRIDIDFGLIEMDDDGFMTGYREKPKLDHFVSMGLYVLKRDAVAPFLTPGSYLDMPDLVRQMASAGRRVACFREDCFWLDIGRHEDYEAANAILETRLDEFLPPESARG